MSYTTMTDYVKIIRVSEIAEERCRKAAERKELSIAEFKIICGSADRCVEGCVPSAKAYRRWKEGETNCSINTR